MKVIDLFCGCGGLSLGFQNAGFEILAAADNWQAATQVYCQNFDHPVYQWDLSQGQNHWHFLESLQPDGIIGGPPCQDFSSAGKRNEELGNGNLTLVFAKIVTQLMPQFFVMENVDRFTKSQKYQQVKHIFQQAGYGLTEIILDASLCGVPQKRKRFFGIGIYQGYPQALEPYFTQNLATKPMTVRDYFGNQLGIEYYYRHPRSYQRRGIFSIDKPSPTIRGVNRPIPKNYQRHPGDAAPLSAAVRPLTTLERSYIQTFPKTFKWQGSKTDLEQMIGNAVPVKLAEFVANCLHHFQNTLQYQN